MQKIYKAEEFVEEIMKNFKLVQKETEIIEKKSWDFFVGEKLAAHSEIISIKNNIMLIETDHTGWMQQILWEKKNILKKLKKNAPELQIKNIEIRVKNK